MEQKDIENLKSKEYITEIIDDDKTIYPLSLNGVKKLTKEIAKSKLVDVEYLTVNSFTDYTREQLKDTEYIQLTNTAKLEDIFKVKEGEPVKPKFIFCFLNKTKEETGEKAEKKREKESKTEENIPEHHFLPIILFNGKKYIFDLDLRNIEDSKFVKNIDDNNTFIFNVKPNNTDKKYTRGQLIQADEYNCGTNTVEVAQQIYKHYLKYFYYKEYKEIYRKEYTKSFIPKNERIAKFENYLQKEIRLDGKFVLLSQSSETIEECFFNKRYDRFKQINQDFEQAKDNYDKTKTEISKQTKQTKLTQLKAESVKMYKTMLNTQTVADSLKKEKENLELSVEKIDKLLNTVEKAESKLINGFKKIIATDMQTINQEFYKTKYPLTTIEKRKEHEKILKNDNIILFL